MRADTIAKINVLLVDLTKQYPDLRFYDHCYRRIAYDNVLQMQWTKKYETAFIHKATDEELDLVHTELLKYKESKFYLLSENLKSLNYRGKDIGLKLGDRIFIVDGYGKHLRKITYVSASCFEWSAGWANNSQLTINEDLNSKVKFVLNLFE